MQHTSFGPTPINCVRSPFSDAIDLSQGGAGGYDKTCLCRFKTQRHTARRGRFYRRTRVCFTRDQD